jgi:hypothetical protein
MCSSHEYSSNIMIATVVVKQLMLTPLFLSADDMVITQSITHLHYTKNLIEAQCTIMREAVAVVATHWIHYFRMITLALLILGTVMNFTSPSLFVKVASYHDIIFYSVLYCTVYS